ncbi:retrovirus-related pol polyprotein LINE-1 [Tanacetum coccineum]
MPGRSTTEAIHLLRSLMEKYRERQRDLHMAFLGLFAPAYEPQWGAKSFQVEVGLHHSSAISPYLFTLLLDELSRGIQESIPWCMIFADDIVLIAESAEGLNNRIEKWREALEDNGLRDMIPNGVFRAELDVDSIIDKMREGRLRWFGHVKRRPQTAPVMEMLEL